MSLASGVLTNLELRLPTRNLANPRHHNLELNIQLPKNLAPLRRSGCEDYSSGNQIPISRSADSSESEPWTILKVTSNAKSPRIEPGAASTGLVAPIS